MEIEIGNYKVHDSGIVVGNKDEYIDFHLAREIGFVIRISFLDDKDNKETRIEAEKLGNNGGHLKFHNFNNVLGVGNTEPLEIGHLNDRQLLLNYRVYSLENTGKTIQYTWLLGKEVNNAN